MVTTIDLPALGVFVAVAQAGSFTRAAALLGQDKSQVSRQVGRLEAALRTPLLARTTRSVRLTVEGEALLRKVAPLLEGLKAAVSDVPDRAASPSGEVVVTTTPDLGRALLAPALVGFRARFPLLQVKVVLTSQALDLVRDGIDLALRVGRPGGQDLVARRVGDLAAGFYASPRYLERRGAPMTLEQLGGHDGLWPAPPRGQRSFSPGRVEPRPAIECDDFGMLAELARADAGVALLPTVVAARDVHVGALVRVLPGFSLGAAPLYLLSRPVRPLATRVSALRSWLLETLATA